MWEVYVLLRELVLWRDIDFERGASQRNFATTANRDLAYTFIYFPPPPKTTATTGLLIVTP